MDDNVPAHTVKSKPSTIRGIRQALVEEWDKSAVEEIQNYVDTMPTPIQELVDNHEAITPWHGFLYIV